MRLSAFDVVDDPGADPGSRAQRECEEVMGEHACEMTCRPSTLRLTSRGSRIHSQSSSRASGASLTLRRGSKKNVAQSIHRKPLMRRH